MDKTWTIASERQTTTTLDKPMTKSSAKPASSKPKVARRLALRPADKVPSAKSRSSLPTVIGNLASDDILLLVLIFLLKDEEDRDDFLFIFLIWLFVDGIMGKTNT